MNVILQTPRLSLREMSLDDLDFVASMLSDPEVMRYYPKCYTRSEAQAWIERQLMRYEQHGHGLWLVNEKTTGEPVGQVGLVQQLIEATAETEVGYLIHRPFWRRGLGTEAARGCRDFAFQELGKKELISLIRPVNIPSQGVATNIGMSWKRRRVQHANLEHCVFTITRSEWQAELMIS
ncbi:GNAT family N-acetyltransferase [Symmachiella dynata]|uniref:GNAT family N-acetyltransferase n=1 Tax=Symmachiella dynata TaxID=2527995 RepID=UPI0030EF1B74